MTTSWRTATPLRHDALILQIARFSDQRNKMYRNVITRPPSPFFRLLNPSFFFCSACTFCPPLRQQVRQAPMHGGNWPAHRLALCVQHTAVRVQSGGGCLLAVEQGAFVTYARLRELVRDQSKLQTLYPLTFLRSALLLRISRRRRLRVGGEVTALFLGCLAGCSCCDHGLVGLFCLLHVVDCVGLAGVFVCKGSWTNASAPFCLLVFLLFHCIGRDGCV